MGSWGRYVLCRDDTWVRELAQRHQTQPVAECVPGWHWLEVLGRESLDLGPPGPGLVAYVVDSDCLVVHGLVDDEPVWTWVTDPYLSAEHSPGEGEEPPGPGPDTVRELAAAIVDWAAGFGSTVDLDDVLEVVDRGWILHERGLTRLARALRLYLGPVDPDDDLPTSTPLPQPEASGSHPAWQCSVVEDDGLLTFTGTTTSVGVRPAAASVVRWLAHAWNAVGLRLLTEDDAEASSVCPWEMRWFAWEPAELLAGTALTTARGRPLQDEVSPDGVARMMAKVAADDVTDLVMLAARCGDQGEAGEPFVRVSLSLVSPWSLHGQPPGPCTVAVEVDAGQVPPDSQAWLRQVLADLAAATPDLLRGATPDAPVPTAG